MCAPQGFHFRAQRRPVGTIERPLTVSIAGGSPVEVEPGRSGKVRVSEGDFSVQVSGATTRSIDVCCAAASC